VEIPRFVRDFQARGESPVFGLFHGASFPPPHSSSFQLVWPHISLGATARFSISDFPSYSSLIYPVA